MTLNADSKGAPLGCDEDVPRGWSEMVCSVLLFVFGWFFRPGILWELE
jgi:hypothetical protein